MWREPAVGKKLGTVALFLGAFLLALAALSKFYMYDQLAVAPMNQDSTSISETAPGADAEYLDAAAGLKVTNGPLKNVKAVRGDVKASKQASKDLNKDVAVWHIYDSTDKPTFDFASGETALSATDDTVAFDRNTGRAVAWKGTKSIEGGKTVEPGDFEGLYFKFPFGSEKKSYPFWDGTLRKATPAKYVGEGKVKGMRVYKYRQTIEPITTGTIDVPGTLVGSDGSTVTADQVYSSVSDYSVDPVTGVILYGQTAQDSYLELDGQRALTTTKATLGYTDANVAKTVNDFKSKSKLLAAVRTTVPIGGLVIGLILISVGLLTRRNGKSEGSRKADAPELVGSH